MDGVQQVELETSGNPSDTPIPRFNREFLSSALQGTDELPTLPRGIAKVCLFIKHVGTRGQQQRSMLGRSGLSQNGYGSWIIFGAFVLTFRGESI